VEAERLVTTTLARYASVAAARIAKLGGTFEA